MSRFGLVRIAALVLALGIEFARGQGLPSLLPKAAFEPVVVTAARLAEPASEVLADVTIIGPDEIARAGQSSVADLLARQPGVEISTNGGPAGSTAVFLRGANGNHTIVLLDGVRIASST